MLKNVIPESVPKNVKQCLQPYKIEGKKHYSLQFQINFQQYMIHNESSKMENKHSVVEALRDILLHGTQSNQIIEKN